MEQKRIESLQGKCKNCGGNLVFNPANQQLSCKNCKCDYKISTNKDTIYHNLTQTADESDEYRQYIEQNKRFKCPNCGANVVLNKYEISQICPYCSTSLVITKQTKNGLYPDAIIPFQFNKEEAQRRFSESIKKRFFAPRKFKKSILTNNITGIYFPSFGFNASTKSEYEGRLYNEETVTDSDGHSHTERDYFFVSGKWNCDYKNIMVECSSKITQKDLHGFLPYNYEEKKSFSNSYILGYSVEQYDMQVKDCAITYNQILKDSIRRDILRKYSYDGVSYLNVKTEKIDEKYQYFILPVYKFEYDYKNKKYITYMNGQIGKVDGNTPISGLKIAIIIAIPILIFLIIGMIIMFGKK